MTKIEAIQAMKEGKRVRHTTFEEDSYMTYDALISQFVINHAKTVNINDYIWKYGWKIVPSNVVEEDEANGHPYPGHEMWNDDDNYEDERNYDNDDREYLQSDK